MSSQDVGAQDFVDAVWPNGELYIDEEEAFKKALGGGNYKMWWLLKPSVVRNMIAFVKSFGQSAVDVTDKKTQMMGGAFVVKGGEVVYTHRENAQFDNGDAKLMLAACLGKDADIERLRPAAATPAQVDVVCTSGK